MIWDLHESADDRVDVTDEAAVIKGIERIVGQFGRIESWSTPLASLARRYRSNNTVWPTGDGRST